MHGQDINKILETLFLGTDIRYEIDDRLIMVYTEKEESVFQQQKRSVSGLVTDTGGKPLPGVTVAIKGTTQGTITGTDGDFSLASPALHMSFLSGDANPEIDVEGAQVDCP